MAERNCRLLRLVDLHPVLLTALATVAAAIALTGAYLAIDRWDLFELNGAWHCDQFESKADAQMKLAHEQRHHDQGSIENLDPDDNGRACDGWNHKDLDGYLSQKPRPLRPGELSALSKKLVRHFREATGETLLLDEDMSWDGVQKLDLIILSSEDDFEWTAEDQRLAEEFGTFAIRVVPNLRRVADELPAGPDGYAQEPDENGIYWDVFEDDEEGTLHYSAVKPYGRVVLDWSSDTVGYPELGPTFWRLDRILRDFQP
jgi:hypothetical protein